MNYPATELLFFIFVKYFGKNLPIGNNVGLVFSIRHKLNL